MTGRLFSWDIWPPYRSCRHRPMAAEALPDREVSLPHVPWRSVEDVDWRETTGLGCSVIALRNSPYSRHTPSCFEALTVQRTINLTLSSLAYSLNRCLTPQAGEGTRLERSDPVVKSSFACRSRKLKARSNEAGLLLEDVQCETPRPYGNTWY